MSGVPLSHAQLSLEGDGSLNEKERKAIRDAAAWRAARFESSDLGGLSNPLVHSIVCSQLVDESLLIRSPEAAPLLAQTKCLIARLPSMAKPPPVESVRDDPVAFEEAEKIARKNVCDIPDIIKTAVHMELPVCWWTDLPASEFQDMRSKMGLEPAQVLVAPPPGSDWTAIATSMTGEPKVYVVTGIAPTQIYELVLCLQMELGPCVYLASSDDERVAMACAAAGVAEGICGSDSLKAASCAISFDGRLLSAFDWVRVVRNFRDEPAKFIGGGNACKGRCALCCQASVAGCLMYFCCLVCPCHPCNPDRRARKQLAALEAMSQYPSRQQAIGKPSAPLVNEL